MSGRSRAALASHGDAIRSITGTMAYSVLATAALGVIGYAFADDGLAVWFVSQAVATPLAFLTSFRLKEQFAVGAADDLVGYRMRRSVAVAAAVGLLATAVWILAPTSALLRDVGIAVLWANLAQSVIHGFQGILVRSGRFVTVLVADVTQGGLLLASVAVGAIAGDLRLTGVLLAGLWSVLAALFWFQHRQEMDGGMAGAVSLREDALVGFASMLQIGQISTIRLGTAVFVGSIAVANVSTASYLVRLGIPVVAGVRMVASSAHRRAFTEGAERWLEYRRSTATRFMLLLALGVAPVAVFAEFAGPPILKVVFGPDVRPESGTLAVVAVSGLFLFAAMLLTQLHLAAGERSKVAATNLWSGGIALALIAPMTMLFGELGAALTLLATYLVWWAVVTLDLLGVKSARS